MRTLTTLGFLVFTSVLPGTASTQVVQAEPGRPSRPEAAQTPREATRGPQRVSPDVQVEFDGIDGVVRAHALEQLFAIAETSGRRLPQATVTFTGVLDESTAELLKHHTRGTRFREVVLTGAVGPDRTKLTIRLSDVVIEKVQVHTTAESADQVVTLRFGKIAWNGDGNTFEWNYATMTAR